MRETAAPPTIKQAKQMDASLGRLIEPLAEETPLSLEMLARRAEPGQPLDTLNACIIILELSSGG